MHSFILFLVFFAGCLRFVKAQQQTQPSFNLSLTSTLANTEDVSECEAVTFKLVPASEGSGLNVVQPFYMLSFELGGIGRSDFLGSDSQNLTWTVRHPQGNQVIFYVVDGGGSMSDLELSVIQAGNTTNCHPTQSPTDFKLVTDSSSVATCDDINFSITGGMKPYTVTMIGEGDTVLNYTLGMNDDGFDYVNRVNPGESFIIAVSDSRGRWGIGTNFLTSVGSTDLSCPGKESGGTSSSSGSKPSNKGPIIGGVIAGIILLLIGTGLATYFYIKRRKEDRLSAANRRDIPFDDEDVSPYVLPPDPSARAYVPVSTVTRAGTMPVSDISEVPVLHSQHVSRHPTLLSGEQVSSHSGSVYSAPYADGYVTQPPRAASPETVTGGGLQLASASVRPMTEKERVMAREQEERRQQVVQHVDAEDILDVPPLYKERVGGPSSPAVV